MASSYIKVYLFYYTIKTMKKIFIQYFLKYFICNGTIQGNKAVIINYLSLKILK